MQGLLGRRKFRVQYGTFVSCHPEVRRPPFGELLGGTVDPVSCRHVKVRHAKIFHCEKDSARITVLCYRILHSPDRSSTDHTYHSHSSWSKSFKADTTLSHYISTGFTLFINQTVPIFRDRMVDHLFPIWFDLAHVAGGGPYNLQMIYYGGP